MELENHQGIAAVLSFLMPGLGQIYNGKSWAAGWFFIVHTILLLIVISSIIYGEYLQATFFAICCLANSIYSATNAYNLAIAHNKQFEDNTYEKR
jgi:TM2 domain-containing membrane protein YozV